MVLWVMGLLLSNTNGGWGREGSHGFLTSVRLDRDRSLLRYCNCPFDCLSIDGQIYHNISLTSKLFYEVFTFHCFIHHVWIYVHVTRLLKENESETCVRVLAIKLKRHRARVLFL